MTQRETKQCQNCKKEFIIESDDFDFYNKIKVPPPTWCPECRFIRRFNWRNERTFYKRICNLCGKEFIGMYPKSDSLVVFCNQCWWSDKWDPRDDGLTYDFSTHFFIQFKNNSTASFWSTNSLRFFGLYFSVKGIHSLRSFRKE